MSEYSMNQQQWYNRSDVVEVRGERFHVYTHFVRWEGEGDETEAIVKVEALLGRPGKDGKNFVVIPEIRFTQLPYGRIAMAIEEALF